MIELVSVATIWVMQYCVDFCSKPSIRGELNPRIEIHQKKTECEQSRTELIDQGAKANRWVWARCIEEPVNGHFNYLTE